MGRLVAWQPCGFLWTANLRHWRWALLHQLPGDPRVQLCDNISFGFERWQHGGQRSVRAPRRVGSALDATTSIPATAAAAAVTATYASAAITAAISTSRAATTSLATAALASTIATTAYSSSTFTATITATFISSTPKPRAKPSPAT